MRGQAATIGRACGIVESKAGAACRQFDCSYSRDKAHFILTLSALGHPIDLKSTAPA